MSKEYRLALEKISCSKQVIGGHYQVALPRRPGALSLTNNRVVAQSRLLSLKEKNKRDPAFSHKYNDVLFYLDVISNYLDENYVRKSKN